MDSSAGKDQRKCSFRVSKHPSRTPSFSSSSSLSSSSCYFMEASPLSPASPLRFSGVPFSWEQLPGIPKKSLRRKDSTKQLRPLMPPPATLPNSKKYHFFGTGNRKKLSTDSSHVDPFFAAFVECSKDDSQESKTPVDWNCAKVSRSISDRFGFVNIYASCKRTCAVSESIIYLPRSTRTSYDLINRNSGLPLSGNW